MTDTIIPIGTLKGRDISDPSITDEHLRVFMNSMQLNQIHPGFVRAAAEEMKRRHGGPAAPRSASPAPRMATVALAEPPAWVHLPDLPIMPCGHPIQVVAKVRGSKGTYCRWCRDVKDTKLKIVELQKAMRVKAKQHQQAVNELNREIEDLKVSQQPDLPIYGELSSEETGESDYETTSGLEPSSQHEESGDPSPLDEEET